MFSGQGSHYYQMGRILFDEDAHFRESMLHLDGIVTALSGRSVVQALYHSGHGKADPFIDTALTHPAIVMVEYSMTRVLAARGLRADLTLGASLGSFAAAVASGFISIEDALALAIQHACALESRCKPGAMLAVLAEPKLHREEFLSSVSELAGVNFASHFVISTPLEYVPGIEDGLRRRGIAYQLLPVSFAFHSRWIDEAREALVVRPPASGQRNTHVPMTCCAHARILDSLPEDYFWTVARQPILFQQTIALLETRGPNRYIDVGPAGTLATVLKYLLPASSSSTFHSTFSPYNRERSNLDAIAPAPGV